VVHDVAEKKARWSWERLVEQRKQRDEYVELYMRFLKSKAGGKAIRQLSGATWKDEHKKRLSALHTALTENHIVTYRSLAVRHLQRWRRKRDHRLAAERDEASKRGWASTMWGWAGMGGGSRVEGEDEREDAEGLTSDLWRQLQVEEEASREDASRNAASVLSAEFVKAHVQCHLERCAVVLVAARKPSESDTAEQVEMALEGVHANVGGAHRWWVGGGVCLFVVFFVFFFFFFFFALSGGVRLTGWCDRLGGSRQRGTGATLPSLEWLHSSYCIGRE
jgi:hypothetical protein